MRPRRDAARIARVTMALALTAMVAITLWWGFLKGDSGPAATGMRLQLDTGRLADGPVPRTFDEGEPALSSVSPTDPGAQFSIRNHRLTYQPTAEGVAAAYFSSPDMGRAVTSMGATFVFEPGPGGTYGAVALIVSRGIQEAIPQIVAPIPIHFVITARNWNLSLTHANEPLENIAAEDFPEPLTQDGQTSYRTSLEMDGGELTIHLPSGERRIIKDARISQWQGNFATFEVYSNNGLSDSVGGFQQIWADSTGRG
jgi:hypothetical protein